MYKKLIIVTLCSLICSIHAMRRAPEGNWFSDAGDVLTDGAIVLAIESNAPDALKSALDARMGNIKLLFQTQLDQAQDEYAMARRQQSGTGHNCVTSFTYNLQLEKQYRECVALVAEQYLLAREKFKNKEVPEYLRLAQRIAKKPCSTQSELFGKGCLICAAALVGTVNMITSDSSLIRLVLVPLCLTGYYYGGKNLFDAQNYKAYLEDQRNARNAIKKILRARQGNWFEQAMYQLKKN